MKRRPTSVSAGLACLLLAGCGQPAKNMPVARNTTDIRAPVANISPHPVRSPHGTRIDDYYWLRDDDRKDPAVLAYLAAENAYTEAQLEPVGALQQRLFDELVGRIKKDDSTVPARHRGYWYYERYEGDAEYPVIARRRDSPGAPESVMLDVNELASAHDYYHVAHYDVSPDNRLLAYAEDITGERIYTIRFKNLETGETLPDALPGNEAAIAWAGDNRTIFYIEKDPGTLLGVRVRRHRLGDAPGDDALVYEEQDHSFYLGIGHSGDERYILLQITSTVSDEYRYLPTDEPEGAFDILLPRERNHEYDADHVDDRWIIRTNWQAENFRLMSARDDAVGDRSGWTELVPHHPQVYIAEFDVFKRYIAIAERRDGLRSLRILPRDGGDEFPVAAEQPVYVMSIDDNPEQDTDWLRYSYSSPTTPDTIYEINMKTRERRLLKQDEVLGGFSSDDYVTERLWSPVRDDERVPVTVVYRRGFAADGSAPLYLRGYGAYGLSEDPVFDVDALALLDRGFVCAIAHVRGGQELGRRWYDDGRLLNKINTFTDFIDVTEFLVSKGYAHPDRVVAYGGSAGGLLIGAVANMRPDLYRVIVADVPFVDVLTTMLDESIPLTTGEFDEWGNPRQQPYHDYMLRYSPYDNVVEQDYPAMLVMTGLWDTQVQYFEPAKWVAKLRAMKTDRNRLLLHINMDAGHGGRSGRFRANHELAMQYAFILDELGLAAREAIPR